MGTSPFGKSKRNIDECGHCESNKRGPEIETCVYAQKRFHDILTIERRRSERSGDCFVLMLVDIDNAQIGKNERGLIAEALKKSTRGIDICGWYSQNSVIGIIFTEMDDTCLNSSMSTLHTKTVQTINSIVSDNTLSYIKFEYHVFPDRGNSKYPDGRTFNILFYPDALNDENYNKNSVIKRIMDIIGSLLALFLFLPLFLIIPLLIKMTSRGPVLFKQERVGLDGKKFTFYKFRSMYQNNSDSIHREYIKRLIKKEEGKGEGNQKAPVYKIRNDPRITPIGRFIRRTSLDEFPQFFNVLKGDMSLVGPRPPIAYEVEDYDCWHRYRLFGVKPGITGLWQVGGRSSVKFDGMVRLDITYIKNWSLWLDIKILLKTPLAVVRCRGAY